MIENDRIFREMATVEVVKVMVLFSIFHIYFSLSLSLSVPPSPLLILLRSIKTVRILTFSCSINLSFSLSQFFTSVYTFLYPFPPAHGFASIINSRKTLDRNVRHRGWNSWHRRSGRFFLVLRSVSARFEAPPPLGAVSVCSPLETSPERAGARARDRDGDRRRDEDGIETDGQSRGVDALASRREARNEA